MEEDLRRCRTSLGYFRREQELEEHHDPYMLISLRHQDSNNSTRRGGVSYDPETGLLVCFMDDDHEVVEHGHSGVDM